MRAVNLLPPEQRSRLAGGVGRSQGGAYAVLAVLAGLAILAVLYGIASHQISSRRTQVASLSAQAARAKATAAQLAPYTSFQALREQRMQDVAQLVDSRFDWAHAFHELGRVLPKDASIATLTGTVGSPGKPGSGGSAASSSQPASASASSSGATGAAGSSSAASSATPPGSVPSFLLSGCATSQSEVALTLQRLRLIDGVSEVTLQSSTKSATGGSGEAGCPAKDPAFSVQITFAALPPSPLPGTSTARLTSSTGGAG
jgi:Tfp pilus assembly protein PilN